MKQKLETKYLWVLNARWKVWETIQSTGENIQKCYLNFWGKSKGGKLPSFCQRSYKNFWDKNEFLFCSWVQFTYEYELIYHISYIDRTWFTENMEWKHDGMENVNHFKFFCCKIHSNRTVSYLWSLIKVCRLLFWWKNNPLDTWRMNTASFNKPTDFIMRWEYQLRSYYSIKWKCLGTIHWR